MSLTPIVIAVAGSTGRTGSRTVRALLSETTYPSKVSRVVAFTRNANSPMAQELKALGAQIETAPIAVETLKGVDVFVSCLTAQVPFEEMDRCAIAAAEAGVKVYFPNELGIKWRSLKVVSFTTGPFLDLAFVYGPTLGLDTAGGVYEVPGSIDAKVSFAALDDIGLSLARLAVLAGQDPSSVPTHVRINGDAKSFAELVEIVAKQTGKPIEARSIDEETSKKMVKSDSYFDLLRVCFGRGQVGYTEYNMNELINPGESLWKWKTVEQYVQKTGGNFATWDGDGESASFWKSV